MENLQLILLLIIPLVGAVACALMPEERRAKYIALAASGLAALVGVWLAFSFEFDPMIAGAPINIGNIESINLFYDLKVDAISLWLVVLTVFLMPLAIAASFNSITDRPRQYYVWMLLLEVVMLGVFMADHAILFYIFFELTLVPMFFIIGIWGGPQRRAAAGKFFLFTFAGSVFTLAAILYLGIRAGRFEFNAIYGVIAGLSGTERFWLTLGLMAGFAVKVPLFPVHTWLPLAHTEAPTAGSVILAGVLLKLGTYGILRFALPVGFATNPGLLHLIGALCIVGIIYGALVAWVQQDIKKLVAYSSVSHLGFCVLGLAALNPEGVQGSVLYMINHGLSTGAMFLVIGMIYDRFHTRDIDALSGLARRMPKMAFFFVLFVLSSIGLPGLNGFWSEFLTILGAFISPHLGVAYGVLAATGIVLGAVYMLHMTARVIWGPLKTPGHDSAHSHDASDEPQSPESHADANALPKDLSAREMGILVPIALAVVILGVAPAPLMRTLSAPVEKLLTIKQHQQQNPPTQGPPVAQLSRAK